MASVASEMSNQATEAVIGLITTAYADDRAGVARFAESEMVRRDRRRLGGPTVVGRDEFWTAARGILDVGFNRWTASTLDLRGEAHALVRVQQSADTGYAMEWLVVIETNDDGRIVELVYFDPEGVDAAIAELDRLHAESRDDSPGG
jgi:hypothetical protein